MNMYAIRKRGTMFYMPALKASRGYSHTEPEPDGGAHGPRLFVSWRAAKAALRMWKSGVWAYEDRVADAWNDDEKTLRFEARPERAGIELEIVTFELVEVGKNGR